MEAAIQNCSLFRPCATGYGMLTALRLVEEECGQRIARAIEREIGVK